MNIEQLKAKLATLEKGTAEYHETLAAIQKLEQSANSADKVNKLPKKEESKISDAQFKEFQRLAPEIVTKQKVTKELVETYMLQNDNDLNKAATKFVDDCLLDRVTKIHDYRNYENNTELHTEIGKMVGEVLNNLPEARVLVQDILNERGTDEYDLFIDAVMPAFRTISAGSGIDVTTLYLPKVKVFDRSLTPSEQDRVDFAPENFSKNWKVTLGKEIYQSAIIVTEGDYIEYFLSGKVSEYIRQSISGIAAAIKVKQYIDCFMLLRNMYEQLKNKPASTDEAPTNHIVGSKTSFLDALKEFKTAKMGMLQHNTTNFYQEDCGAKYTVASEKNIKLLVPIKTFTTKETYDLTSLTSKGVENVAGKFIWVPEQIYDPVSERIIDCNIFTIKDQVSEGCILAVDSSKFVRLTNLNISNQADYNWGLTKAYSSYSRYGQGYAPNGSIMLYENEEALTQDFVIPTQEKTPSKKAKK